MKRVLTALVLVPCVTGVVFYAPSVAVSAGLAVVALLCLREFFGIAEAGGVRLFQVFGYAATAALIFFPELPQPGFFVGLVVVLLILSLGPRRAVTDSAAGVGATLLGVVYIGGAFALGRELHGISPHWLFWVLLLNWAGDSAAYYAGRAFGRHKLAPRVSPNKTWEGAIASTVAAGVVGSGYWVYFMPQSEIGWPVIVLSAVLVNVAGQAGDLAESLLKRCAGVKDSGDLLPGHGGMLDRVDGVLFSAPMLYWVLWVVG